MESPRSPLGLVSPMSVLCEWMKLQVLNCNFCLSVAALEIVLADPSLRYALPVNWTLQQAVVTVFAPDDILSAVLEFLLSSFLFFCLFCFVFCLFEIFDLTQSNYNASASI